MAFCWVYSFPLDQFLCLSFGFLLCLYSFRMVYNLIWTGGGVLHTPDQWTVVIGLTMSHHNRHWAWPRTEQQQLNRDTEITDMGRVMGAYGDTLVIEMDWVTGSLDQGELRVERHHLIIQWNNTLYLPIGWSQSICPTNCGSTELWGSSEPGHTKFSHSDPNLPRRKPLFSTNCFRLPLKVWQHLDYTLFAFLLLRFTTQAVMPF